MQKGQGLPINTLVLAAIAILVLIMIIAFATGTFSRLFKGVSTIEQGATPEELTGFRVGCEQACFAAKQLTRTTHQFEASDYCKRTIKVNETNKLVSKNCWQSPINVSCSFELVEGDVTKSCSGEGTTCTCK